MPSAEKDVEDDNDSNINKAVKSMFGANPARTTRGRDPLQKTAWCTCRWLQRSLMLWWPRRAQRTVLGGVRTYVTPQAPQRFIGGDGGGGFPNSISHKDLSADGKKDLAQPLSPSDRQRRGNQSRDDLTRMIHKARRVGQGTGYLVGRRVRVNIPLQFHVVSGKIAVSAVPPRTYAR